MRTALGTSLAALLLLGATVPAAGSGAPDRSPDLEWQVDVVDADQSFRGLDAVDRRTAWVVGASVTRGAARIYLTTDGGVSWRDMTPPGTEGLNFRDVEAEDARTASVLAIGEGEASRIYRTTDGGRTWTETFRNAEPSTFHNCMDFFPGGQRGLAVSDPVNGRFRVISTEDGGRSWQVLGRQGCRSRPGSTTSRPAVTVSSSRVGRRGSAAAAPRPGSTTPTTGGSPGRRPTRRSQPASSDSRSGRLGAT